MPAAADDRNDLDDTTPHRDRVSLTVRVTPEAYELMRRRMLADKTTVQAVLAAGVNAYALGDLRVRPNGRYWVEAPPAPVQQDDTVAVRAPVSGDEHRAVTVRQDSVRGPQRGTPWLRKHVHRIAGTEPSARMTNALLKHLEDTERIPPRGGRYWRFDGPKDPTVLEFVVALDDGTWDDLVKRMVSRLD